MTGRYGAGTVGILLGLLGFAPAAAQTGDTVRAATADSESVVLRVMPDSVVADWKSDKAFEYANDPAYWRWHELRSGPAASGGGIPQFLASRGFEYFVLFLMGGILLYAITRIIVANRLQLFYRPPRRPMVVKTGEEGSPEDDLEGQLMHFMQMKDYRQAVRYLYLKTLRLLNDRGMIRYHQESTNQEYWRQLSATPQGGAFRDLTSIYEKVWYGEFPLGDALFTRLHQYFEDFYKSVRA
jgi:hypothetical protein